jgi:hypothetical protein
MTSPIMKKMTSPITKRLVKTFSGEVPNFNDEDVDYVDFLGVKDILNSPRDDYGEFYTDEENYMFTRETIPNPFLSIFMAHGREKEHRRMASLKYRQVVYGTFITTIKVFRQ